MTKAKTYSSRFLEAGVVQYNNEMVLLPRDNFMTIAMDFKGAPVCIDHQDLHLMNEEDYKEKIVGYVSRVYKGEDGTAWCDYTIDNSKAIDLIENGCFVSCAYKPTETGEGGTWHNVPYKRTILNGEALHLALVHTPRYEDSIIIENSKGENDMKTLFKILKNDKKEEKHEVKEISLENAIFEVAEGEQISAKELVEFYNAKKNEKEEKEEKEERKEKDEDADKKENSDEMEVDGEKVKVSELKNSYRAMKKNEADKKKADEETKENSKKEDKQGEESFKTLENARFDKKAEATKGNYISEASKFAAGKAIYGKSHKAK